jgi:hypothetical protein
MSGADRPGFVLQFSTGERYAVQGGGLLGRHPVREPGEWAEHLIRVPDAGRSVSKTHLEFGLEDGELWIMDRFSGNGTVLWAPGAPPQRCEGGRRYRAPRGSRVEIGDQFFLLD